MKKAGLKYPMCFSDFDLFIKGFEQGLAEDGAKCEMMYFDYEDDNNHEKILTMVEKIGWNVYGEPFYHLNNVGYRNLITKDKFEDM